MAANRNWLSDRAREIVRVERGVSASRALMGMTALCFVCPAHGQQGSPIAGIHHFEVVLLGDDVDCGDEHNTAYEVTDCGLVVGQRARQLAGGQCDPLDPSRRRIAFVYAVTPQFGIAPGNLVELPNPDPVDGQVGAADLGMLLNRWGSTCSWPQCATLVEDVPASAIQRAMESVDFASELVGRGDFAGYRLWREAVPAPIVQIVDEFVWSVAKGGS